MKGIGGRRLILALVVAACAAQGGWAQNPGPVEKTAPGKGAAQTPEEKALNVEAMNQLTRVDRENLQGYWAAVNSRTKEHWLLPALARPPQSTPGVVEIECWVHTDGRVTNMVLVQPSGKVPLDRAAWAAITGSAPYEAFPYGIGVDRVKVRFTFLYNGGDQVLNGGGKKPNG
jgi:TonB family protein